MVKDEMHYFTWLSIPLVKTGPGPRGQRRSITPGWAAYLTTPRTALSNRGFTHSNSSTTIEQLWIDIRLLGDTSTRRAFESPRDRTSWAICAALKHVFEHDPDIIPTRDCRNDVTIDEVILNVVPPTTPVPKTTTHYLVAPNNSVLEAEKPNMNHPENVAKELVDVWNKLWSGDEFKARYYKNLLERIKIVRICVDGVTFRVRELRVELDRGQAEARRIEMRMR